METSDAQKLVNIVFQVGLVISDEKYQLYKLPIEKKAEWIRKQLSENGFETKPVGASWGVLIKNTN